MFEFCSGDILNEKVPIMIPVNTVGVMGAGLAKQAKNKSPLLEREYLYSLKNGSLDLGKPSKLLGNKYILFATKEHWKDPSRLDWINQGFANFIERDMDGIKVVAIPKLGCGLGGLQWIDVLTLIYVHFQKIDIEVRIYGEEIDLNQIFNIKEAS